MNEIQKIIHETVVSPALRQRLHGTTATVLARDHIQNIATIEFPDPYGEGYTVIENVPLQIAAGGIHSAGPFPGDEVWVNFMGGNIMYPQVVSIIDYKYYLSTREHRMQHNGRGTHLPDSICGGGPP